MKSAKARFSNFISYPFNAIATPVDLIFCVPTIGRITKWGWNILLTLLHVPSGFLEWLFLNLGKKPIKKLKVSVVIFPDEHGAPIVEPDQVVKQLEETAALYEKLANIRVVSANANASPTPSENWLTYYNGKPSNRVMKVGCNQVAFREDLWLTGMHFQFTALSRLFNTNFRRIIGYGSPVVVFIVDKVGEISGCSLGPLTDYVTIARTGLSCMAHEIGHACSLLHKDGVEHENNLMHPRGCKNAHLSTGQIAIMRASRHVTFV